MMVRVIDIETTGIDPAKDAIVEVASVDLTHEKAITNKGDLEAWHWPGAMLPLSGGKLTDYSRRRESRSDLCQPFGSYEFTTLAGLR